MAENTSSPITKVLITIIVVLLIAFGGYYYMSMGNSPSSQTTSQKTFVQVSYPEKIYQLQDGSYLRLGFAILVAKDQEDEAEEILTEDKVHVVADGINMIVGDMGQDDLINGAHKREAFAAEIKKMLEKDVFHSYNAAQRDPADRIEIKDVLIHQFVTQQN